MWPQDLKFIYNKTKNLSIKAGFLPSTRPYIYQEVTYLDGEAIKRSEYNKFANVIEFQFGAILGSMFRGQDKLSRLKTFDNPKAWKMLYSGDALVMVDNHDNQRGHGSGGSTILTYKDPKPYKVEFDASR